MSNSNHVFNIDNDGTIISSTTLQQSKTKNASNKNVKTKDNNKKNNQKCYERILNRKTPCPKCPRQKVVKNKMAYFHEYKTKGNPPFLLTLSPLFNASGEVVGVQETVDCFEQKPRQYFHTERLESLVEALGKTDSFLVEKKVLIESIRRYAESQNHILAQIAHQLNHPLAVTKGFVDLFLMDPTAHNKEVANAEIDRIIKLVEKLVKFSKIELGTARLKLEKVKMHTYLKETFECLFYQNKHHSLLLQNITIQNWAAEIDKNEFRYVLNVLVENAFTYVPKGGTITIGIKKINEKNVVFVQDNGKGFSKLNQEKIFDPFFQISPSVTGAGLGLWIAKKIVEQHGGKMWAESTVGKGSTFFIAV